MSRLFRRSAASSMAWRQSAGSGGSPIRRLSPPVAAAVPTTTTAAARNQQRDSDDAHGRRRSVAVLSASPFHGEAIGKVWARLRMPQSGLLRRCFGMRRLICWRLGGRSPRWAR